MVFSFLIAVFFRRDSKIINPRIVFLSFCGLFFLFGIGRFNLFNPRQHIIEKFAQASADLRNVSDENKVKIALYGYIDEEPEIRGDKQNLILKSKILESGGRFFVTDEKILITVRLYPKHHFGEKLKIFGEPFLPENFSDNGGGNFDYINYLAKDQIYTLMRYPDIAEGNQIKLGFWEKTKIAVYGKIFTVRRIFEASINRSLAEPNASFVSGILLGSRSQIPDDLKQAFSRTSTTHILAISGYNITIIAWVISSILLLFLRRPVAFWFSMAGIMLFTVVTGAGASVIRAAIMGSLLLFAGKEGRLYGAANAVIFAGAVMVLINPGILRYDIGFQLSFMATLGLIYLAPVMENKIKFLKMPDFFKIKENFTMSLSAQVFVLPLILFYFKNLSLVSLPVNILVLPLVPYTMLSGFIMGLAGIISPFIGQLFGYFVWFLSSIQLWVIRIFAKPKWAAVFINFPWYLVVLAYVLILFYLWHFNFKATKPKTHDT